MSVKRIGALRKAVKRDNLDGIIITNLDHIRYLSGFTGSNALLIVGSKGTDFFTDSRYTDQSRRQVKGARVHIVRGDTVSSLKDFKQFHSRHARYGIDGENLTLAARNRLQHSLPDSILIETDGLLTELGWVKEAAEITAIRKAVKITDTVFERILNMVEPGIRESEVAAEMEYQMMMLGSSKPAFETIVASGYRSAMPHGLASQKKIKTGDFVTFDFGATVDGYVSDITRTIVVGKATSRQKKIYDIVLRSQKAGIRKVKAGVTGKAVDDACRRVITRAGFGKQFGHGTGHGIGIIVHTGPRVSPLSKDKLLVNNVITVEPGIYISGWGGVRIEDDVRVTRTGGEVLNRAEKKLLEV